MDGFMNSKAARIAPIGGGYSNSALKKSKSTPIPRIKSSYIAHSGNHPAMSSHNNVFNHRFSNNAITKDTWLANQI